MEHEADYVFWALLIGTFALFVAFAVWQGRRIKRQWRTLADTLGFTESNDPEHWGDYPTLAGNYLGTPVRLRLYTTGSGKNKQHWTSVTFEAKQAPPNFDLKVSKEGIGDWLAKKFGGQDIQLGDETFDRKFRIQSSDADLAARVLDPVTREALLSRSKFGVLTIWHAEVSYVAKGFERKPPFFEDAFPVLHQVTQSLAALPGGTPPVPEALED